jgi:multiple sugar transport system substrate-binding protein
MQKLQHDSGLQGLMSLICVGRISRRLIGAVAAVAMAAGLGITQASAAAPPDQAKIDWMQEKGTTLNVFLVAHPWTTAITPLLPEFEKLTGISVRVTTVSEDAYWDKASLGLAAARPPFDVSFISMGLNGVTAYANKWITPLNRFMDDPKLTDKAWYDYADFYPAAATAFHMPNPSSVPFVGLPMSTEVYMMFYRKDIFASSGVDPTKIKTMDEWMDALGKLKLPPGMTQASLRGAGLGILDELNGMVINAWGNEPYDSDRFVYFDSKWKPRFDDPRIGKGFEYWSELMKRSAPGVTSFDWYEATTQFAQGKSATFGPDASLFASIFKDPKQSTIVGKIGYRVLPAASPDGPHTAIWSWGLSIPEKTKKQNAAWLFLEWATSPYVTEQVSRATLASPRQSTWGNASYQAALPEGFGEAVGASLAVAKPSIMYLEAADQVTQDMLDALQGMYHGTPTAKAMGTLQSAALDVVTKAGLYKP